MSDIVIERARFRRDDNGRPYVLARSPGVPDAWLPQIERVLVGFGIRPPGVACPQAVFVQPLGVMHVAVVQVSDDPDMRGLMFDVLVCPRSDYEQCLGDPFTLAHLAPAAQKSGNLEAITLPRQVPTPRTVAQIQAVLRRVKAGALMENEDPEHPNFERTLQNSESPALLGGVQVLVEGGKLVFQRDRPDAELVEGLWTLLPQPARARLWPASFAFGNALGFDVVVVPRVHAADFEGYTSEEQAAEYPAGHYEMALQTAAEAGNQREVDALLGRRTGRDTLKLAWTLLAAVIVLTLAPRLLDIGQHTPGARAVEYKAAAAAGMVASGDPWTALGLKIYGDSLWIKH